MKIPKAFIFDLDGVITDTAEYHYQAWKNLSEKLGITIDRKFNENLKGVSRMDSLNRILEHGGKLSDFTEDDKVKLATEKNEAYKLLINSITPNDVLPKILDLLETLRNNNIKIGLASASKNAFKVVELLKIGEYFDYIADAAKIENSKPAPDVFLDVMKYFDLESRDCVGIEDAQAGIEAIKTADMLAVGIGKATDLIGADLIFTSTDEVDFEAIITKYNA